MHSEDALRFEKVEALRRGEHAIVFTTTILERGFTMIFAKKDIVSMNRLGKERGWLNA
ncbi:hypothetical protein [Staphylococcus saccharolyticus]|uniref:hypothetical protein n=1 Tax=Staphylococcus saccharolyticus TaxID=33028 RepID=UPI0030834D6F